MPPCSCSLLTDESPAQAAAARVDRDELTVPGMPPGIYACAYRELAAILVLLAEGRLALAHADDAATQVPPPSRACKYLEPFSRCVLACILEDMQPPTSNVCR